MNNARITNKHIVTVTDDTEGNSTARLVIETFLDGVKIGTSTVCSNIDLDLVEGSWREIVT